MATYYQKYGKDKIFGLIDLGGIPVTAYKILIDIMLSVFHVDN